MNFFVDTLHSLKLLSNMTLNIIITSIWYVLCTYLCIILFEFSVESILSSIKKIGVFEAIHVYIYQCFFVDKYWNVHLSIDKNWRVWFFIPTSLSLSLVSTPSLISHPSPCPSLCLYIHLLSRCPPSEAWSVSFSPEEALYAQPPPL